MKSVLISIKPKWCELIASGKKTIEVRKTRPKCEAPFKCYIYCTKEFYRKGDGYFQGKYCGKVIGEFVCDEIYDCQDVNMDDTCITIAEWLKYTKGHEGVVYGWHISDLVIYDKPKDLADFSNGSSRLSFNNTKDGFPWKWTGMTRPPQSWCYVEEVTQ